MSSESALCFPDYVDGEGWSVQLVHSNLSASPSAAVDVEVYDQQGEPVPGFFDAGTPAAPEVNPVSGDSTKLSASYEVRYRHRNSSRCGRGSPGEWSEKGEGTTGR